jgi:hypothetical protein
MKTAFAALILATIATPVIAADAVQTAPAGATLAQKGKMLVSADGSRLATIYRVTPAGAQVIVDGRMITVPADTISAVDGKFKTSLSKSQVLGL